MCSMPSTLNAQVRKRERREAKRLNGVYANTAEALMQASELMLAR